MRGRRTSPFVRSRSAATLLALPLLGLTLLGLTLLACGGPDPAEGPEAAPPAARRQQSAAGFDAEAYMDGEAAPPAAAAEQRERGVGGSARAAPRQPNEGERVASKRESGADARTVQAIFDVIQKHRQLFRNCYDSFLQRHPPVKGDLTIHFVIGPAGKVTSAELNAERSTLKESQLVNCAVTAMKRLRFPESSRGLESKVNYPFNFNP